MAGELVKLQPDNLDVLLERARLAVKSGDAQALAMPSRASANWPAWPTEVQEATATREGREFRPAARP